MHTNLKALSTYVYLHLIACRNMMHDDSVVIGMPLVSIRSIVSLDS
jgi:hypothetical protein